MVQLVKYLLCKFDPHNLHKNLGIVVCMCFSSIGVVDVGVPLGLVTIQYSLTGELQANWRMLACD